jgi:hypothetical protein
MMNFVSTQRGLSLIGLLIGLLISVLCILASLTLYKTMIRVAAESTVDSRHDGQIATASLVIQMEVQTAGYGIANADLDDVLQDAPSVGQQRLLWRYSPGPNHGTTFECRGLHEHEVVENGETFRVLRVIKGTGCNGTAALSSFNWSTEVSVLGRWRVFDDGVSATGLDDHIATHKTLFKFMVSSIGSPCTPFGAETGTAQNHLKLQVTAPGSANLQGAVGVALNTYDYCLANTYPT